MEGLGGSGWRLGASGCYYMAMFICINSSSCTLNDLSTFLYHFSKIKILSLKYIILSLVSMPDMLCVHFF